MKTNTLPRVARKLGLALLLLVALPPQAFAVDPETEVGGNGSKWFSGSLLQMDGRNCDIIGEPRTETMVSAIAGYGGAPGGQIAKVGDRYYASVLISIPGNPCGSGSTSVSTDLFLPRGTSVDTGAPIRCFGRPRNASTFGELTGGSWSFRGYSGQYCPAQVGASQTGAPGTVGVGFRPLANGTMYWLFVPIKSTQALEGASHSPADQIHWFIGASAAYTSPQATSVWVHTRAAGDGTPFIYFARNPSVVPYSDNSAPVGQKNKAEWFANLYSAGLAGNFCWELYDGTTASGPPIQTCTSVSSWNGTVTAGPDTWQVFGDGPNGGYVPFAYPDGATYTIRWTFTPNVGSPVSKDITFTTLAGPDGDGDGVPDASDDCPAVKGTQANGCPPPVQSDPDGDGVFGSSDKCPSENGGDSLDGCPATQPPPPDSDGDGVPDASDACPAVAANTPGGCPAGPTDPPDSDGDGVPDASDTCPAVAANTSDGCPAAVVLTASLGRIRGNTLKRSALVKGVSLSTACGLDSRALATLTLSRAVAKKLKIAVRGRQKAVTIGSASTNCTAARGGKLKLRLKSALAAKVRKPKKAVPATLTVVFTRPGSEAVTVRRAIKLT